MNFTILFNSYSSGFLLAISLGLSFNLAHLLFAVSNTSPLGLSVRASSNSILLFDNSSSFMMGISVCGASLVNLL